MCDVGGGGGCLVFFFLAFVGVFGESMVQDVLLL